MSFPQEKGKKKGKKKPDHFYHFYHFYPSKIDFWRVPTHGKKEDVAALRPAKWRMATRKRREKKEWIIRNETTFFLHSGERVLVKFPRKSRSLHLESLKHHLRAHNEVKVWNVSARRDVRRWMWKQNGMQSLRHDEEMQPVQRTRDGNHAARRERDAVRYLQV